MGTLGFGAYTTATSALSVFLGPVGWIGLGAAAVYSYGKPKYKKLIPVVATIALIRQRLAYEAKLLAEKLAREKAERERLARTQQALTSKTNTSKTNENEGCGLAARECNLICVNACR